MQISSISALTASVTSPSATDTRSRLARRQIAYLFWGGAILCAAASTISIASGAFGAAGLFAFLAVLALKHSLSVSESVTVDGVLPPLARENEPVAILVTEFGIIGGLIFLYRGSIYLELLALLTLLGSFSSAYLCLLARIRGIDNGSGLRSYERVWFLVAACFASSLTASFEPSFASVGGAAGIPLVAMLSILGVLCNANAIRLVIRLLKTPPSEARRSFAYEG